MKSSVLLLIWLGALGFITPSKADLPDLNNTLDTLLSAPEEAKLGQKVRSELFKLDYILDDPELNYYLDTIGRNILNNAGFQQQQFTFYLANDLSINAFAVAGGVIVIHAGLFLIMENEAELASVIAHEIAHISLRHSVRSYEKNQSNSWLIGLAVLAALAARDDPQLASAGLVSGVAGTQQLALSHSRDHEREADRIGQNYLISSGYPALAMAQAFQRLDDASAPEDPFFAYLRTHPVTQERIAAAQSYADQSPPEVIPNENHNQRFRMAQHKVRRLLGIKSKAEIEITDPIEKYYLQLQEALKNHQPLAITLSDSVTQLPHLGISVLALLNQQNLSIQANQLGEILSNLYPQHPGVIKEYSNILINKNPAVAFELLSTLDSYAQEHPWFQRDKAKIAFKTGKLSHYHEAQAKYHELRGEYQAAYNQLALAIDWLPDSAAIRIAKLKLKQQTLNAVLEKENK